jgi:hypothetical protein
MQTTEGLVVPWKPGNAGGGKEPCPDPVRKAAESQVIDDESSNTEYG